MIITEKIVINCRKKFSLTNSKESMAKIFPVVIFNISTIFPFLDLLYSLHYTHHNTSSLFSLSPPPLLIEKHTHTNPFLFSHAFSLSLSLTLEHLHHLILRGLYIISNLVSWFFPRNNQKKTLKQDTS